MGDRSFDGFARSNADGSVGAPVLVDAELDLLALAHAPDIAWIFDYESQRFSHASPQVEAALGYTPREVQDTPLERLLVADDAVRVRDLLVSRLCEFGADPNADCGGGFFTDVIAMVHRSGSTVWIEIAGSLFADDKGRVHAAGIARDVTSRHADYVRIRDAEERYRLAIQYSVTGLAVLDPAGVIVEVSDPLCDMLGCGPSRMRGQRFADIVDAESRSVIADGLEQLVGGLSDTFRGTVKFSRPDGGVSWGDTAGIAVRRTDGSIRYFIMRVADITAQTHAEQELSRVSRTWSVERERLRHTLDSIRDSIVLLEAVRAADDTIVDFRVIDMNRAAEIAGGVSRSHALGHLESEVYPPVGESQVFAHYVRAVEMQQPATIRDVEWWGANSSTSGPMWFEIGVVPYGDTLTATWRDVTEQYQYAKALADSEERFRLLAANLSGVVVKIGLSDVVDWVSPSLTETLGWEPADWLGHRVTEFFHPDDLGIREAVAQGAKQGRPQAARWRVVDSTGEYHWAQFMARPYLNASGELDGMVGTFRIIDTEVAYERELEWRARYDDLSGLLNRRSILDKVAGVVGDDRRGAGRMSAVLFCDIDRLKEINDTYGHAGGDALIVAVSQRMLAAVRESDSVGRIGGDEFLILLDGLQGVDNAIAVAEKVRATAHGPVPLADGVVLEPTLSIGVAIARPGEGVSTLVERANNGLFDAKRTGRDRVVLIPMSGDGAVDAPFEK